MTPSPLDSLIMDPSARTSTRARVETVNLFIWWSAVQFAEFTTSWQLFFFFKHSIILFLSVHVYMYVGAGVCVFLLGRWKTAYLSCCAVFLCKYMQHSCDDVSLCVLFILLCSSCLQQFLLFLKCSAYLMCGCKHITAL